MMLPRRKLLLVFTLFGVGGSLGATVAYAAWVRSSAYRAGVVNDLSEKLGLSASIDAIHPLSLNSREFRGVRVMAPDGSGTVFSCARAVWRDVSVEGRRRYALDLTAGHLLLGTGQWRRSDYQKMLDSGLGHDFSRLRLSEIHLDRIDLEWIHPEFRLMLDGAYGEVLFNDDGMGRATLHSRTLNDVPLDSPVNVSAWFTPGSGLTFHEVVLTVPTLPLGVLGLDRLLRSTVTQGTFAGQLVYREQSADGVSRTLEAAGRLEDASLLELTQPLLGGPYSGRVSATLDQVRFVDGRLDELRFQGNLSGVCLGDVVPVIRATGDDGTADLRIHQAEYRNGVIRYLSVSGRADDISAETLSGLMGYGMITGRLRVRINSLIVVDDRIQSADLEIHAVAPPDRPGMIDRDVLASVAKELFGFDLQMVLPQKIEYAEIGARLVLEHGRLRIHGTHGPDGRTVATIRLFGRDWPVLRAPDRTFEVPDLLALLRDRMEPLDADDLRRWWQEHHQQSQDTHD
ncbi:MAG: hypothetical protein IH988_08755 [Planctomycetes bacterium]|nr:hypothetical protein [Planctomycetota bacterium]